MSSRLGWVLRSTGIVLAAGGAITAGVLLGEYGKSLFNAAML
jgi:hypothetical protein